MVSYIFRMSARWLFLLSMEWLLLKKPLMMLAGGQLNLHNEKPLYETLISNVIPALIEYRASVLGLGLAISMKSTTQWLHMKKEYVIYLCFISNTDNYRATRKSIHCLCPNY